MGWILKTMADWAGECTNQGSRDRDGLAVDSSVVGVGYFNGARDRAACHPVTGTCHRLTEELDR